MKSTAVLLLAMNCMIGSSLPVEITPHMSVEFDTRSPVTQKVGRNATVQLITRPSNIHVLRSDFWNGECFFEIMPEPVPDATIDRGRTDHDAAIIGDHRKHVFYQKDSLCFEWEIVLTKPPDNATLVFPIQTQNLSFYYQDTLSDQEKCENCTRPDSVVHSYAVYHSSKTGCVLTWSKDRLSLNNDYRTGKAFHIYRPRAWDALGDTVWCDVKIDTSAGELALAIPTGFLNTAHFPITIDPTFGYDQVGASGGYAGNALRAYRAVTDSQAEGGQLQSVSFYVDQALGAPYDAIWGLYSYDAANDCPDSLLVGQSSGITITGEGWRTTTAGFASYALTPNTVFFLTMNIETCYSDRPRFRYDLLSGMNWTYWNDSYGCATYPHLPDTFGTYDGAQIRRFSVYGTYIVGSGQENGQGLRRRKVTQQPSSSIQ